MSKIADLGKNYENLPDLLEVYEKNLSQAKEQLEKTGKLELAIRENSAWLHYYDQRRIEILSIVKFFKAEQERVRGKLFKSYKENYSRALGEREINKYIDNEDAYIYVHSLLIEVEELHDLYQSVVNAFVSRNYDLANITKLRVAQLEFAEI